MSKYFGKTWWGEQWLNSLSNIDYSNRLPRGSSYARNGSVTSIGIEENNIRAKVKGSRPKPYDVTVIIPPFFETEIKKLIKAIAEKPVIVSKLLTRELDPEVLAIAERIGLKVFPKQWTDFKMQCSCPDWAVPCKHLAAVIYKISAEIDNNPFLVFNLHRVDLATELKRENIFIEPGNNTIPALKDLLVDETDGAKVKRQKPKVKPAKAIIETDTHSLPVTKGSLNYATLSPIHEPLIQLLADAPPFYQGNGNFREKYAIALRKTVRNAQRIIAGKVSIDEYFGDINSFRKLSKNAKPDFIISSHANIQLGINANNEVTIWVDDKKEAVTLHKLVSLLWQIPSAKLQDYQPTIAALRNSLLLALNLAANGAIVPQIVQLENKTFTIRFLPALISKEVKALIEKLQETLPTYIFIICRKSKHRHSKKC